MTDSKIIILTGAAKGIGRYLAEKLYEQNHLLALSDIDQKGLEETALQNNWDREKIILQSMDVSKIADWKNIIQRTLDKWNKIDVLMNVAGVIRPGYIHELPLESIDFHIDINLKGTIYGTKLVSELMVKQKQGQIINIASLAGITPGRGFNLYCASKFGVRGFSISVAHELREHHVYVSVVCPDLVNTQMLNLQLDYEEAALVFSGNRVLSVQEIGEVVLKKAFLQKKIEVVYPYSRGLLAKLSGFFPRLGTSFIAKALHKKGLKNQEKWRKKQG